MMFEEEEYLDDPIILMDYEQRRFSCHSDDTIIIDDDEYIQTDFDAYISSYPKDLSSLPQQFSMITRNIELLNECRPLQIKIVDCEQFPWYYKRNKTYENIDSDMEDDIIIINKPSDIVDANTVKENEQIIHSDLNLTNINQLKIEIEKQYDLFKKKVNAVNDNLKKDLLGLSVSDNTIENGYNNDIYNSKTATLEYNVDEEKQRFKAFARVIEKAFDKLRPPESASESQGLIKISSNNSSCNQEKYKDNDLICMNNLPANSHKQLSENIFNSYSAKIHDINNFAEQNNQPKNHSSLRNEYITDLKNFDKYNYARKNSNHLSEGDSRNIFFKEIKKPRLEKNKQSSADCKSRLVEKYSKKPERVGKQINETNSNLSPSGENVLIQPHEHLSCPCTKQMYNANRVIPHFHKNAALIDSNLIIRKRNACKSTELKNKLHPKNVNQPDLLLRHELKMTTNSTLDMNLISNLEKNYVKKHLFERKSNCETSIARNNKRSTTGILKKCVEINNNCTEGTGKPLDGRGTKYPMTVQSISDSNFNNKNRINQLRGAESISNLQKDVLNETYQKRKNCNDTYTDKNFDFVTKHPGSAAIIAIQKDYFDEASSRITHSPVEVNVTDNIPQYYYINPNKHTSFIRPPSINPIHASMHPKNIRQGLRPDLANVISSISSCNQISNNNLACSSVPRGVVLLRQRPSLPNPNPSDPNLSFNQVINNDLSYSTVPREMAMFQQNPRLPNFVNSNSNQDDMLINNLRCHSLPRRKVNTNLPPSHYASITRPPPPYLQQSIQPMPNYIPVSKNNRTVNKTMSRALKHIYDVSLSSNENEKSINMRGNNGILNNQKSCDENSVKITTTNKKADQVISSGCLNNNNSKITSSDIQNSNPIMRNLLDREPRPVSKTLPSPNNNIAESSSVLLNKINDLDRLNEKGYSPPILPIPTYQKTFEELAQMNVISLQSSLSHDTSLQQQIEQPMRNNKRKAMDAAADGWLSASKISLEEYKKRSMERRDSQHAT